MEGRRRRHVFELDSLHQIVYLLVVFKPKMGAFSCIFFGGEV
jgi:hypothetical protein